ncbi:MAG TPA: bifunctional DNA primase/helicase [Puia sp.]|jgi:twinkle protein|nr:bifunctional DNA primase/helicase [Puia sp.]
MNDKTYALFDHDEGLQTQGRVYLSDRALSVPMARKCGICSLGDALYFAYRSNGEIVRWKMRSMLDKKETRFNNLPEEQKSNFKMPFYNQQNWPDKDFLIITEGEFDCIALMQLMGRNVVSLPNGAGSIETTFRNQYEYLQDYKIIYICTDMDEAGEKAAQKAMAMLSPAKYRRMMLPYKDANEWVIKDPYLEKKDVEFVMLNAQRIQDDSFKDLRFLDDDVFEKIDLGVPTGWKGLNEVLGGMRIGEVTVVSADTGSGKSTFCVNLMHNIAIQGLGIWINSYEMDYKIIIRKLAGIVLGKKMKFDKFNDSDISEFKGWCDKNSVYINKSISRIDLNVLRNQFEKAAYAYNVKYILLDHLDYIHSSGNKENSFENIDEAVREIHMLAMEFKVGVILVVHPKQVKNGQEISMADLKGSSGIKQFADNILVLTRMDRLDPNDINRVKIRVWKNRLCGIEKAFFLRYLSEIDSYVEGV